MPLEATIAGEGCRLTLRVFDYAQYAGGVGSDSNWVKGEIEMTAGSTGAFSARQSADFLAEHFEQFRDELRAVVETLNGSATFFHIESQVGCTIELANGSGNLLAWVKEHVGAQLEIDECRTDQSYLALTVRELDAIVEAFPVRGVT